MIKSFQHKGLEQFFIHGKKKLLNFQHIPKINRILDRLDTAIIVKDMDVPGWNFHELIGNRKGVFSVAVHKNWKITFCFYKGDAFDVNFEDYH